ncbi:facilitated trehalose transporter Tret1-like [Lycorma delicatula]|uniref:facilitated trehalose transporter Tret1-like n=1 Tax=Lycorma delicatula TaxID=130591 RepID=UPI003F50EC94
MSGLFRQIFAGLAGGLCLMIVGCWLGWPSPFLHKLKSGEISYTLTSSERSWIVSLMDFGNVISPIPVGYMMDWLGRKPTFFATAVIFQISWVLALLADGAGLLYIARFLAGIGKGMGFTVVPMYLAEIAEVKIRGALSTIFTILLFFGTLFEYIIGPYVSYDTLNAISSVIPILFFLLVLFIPESPYYLLMKKDRKGAQNSFSWLRNYKYDEKTDVNAKAKEEINAETELERMDSQVQKEMELRGRWHDLLGSHGTKRATIIVMTLSAFQRLGGVSCMLAYSSITLPATGGGLGPEEYMVLFGLVLTLSNFICLPLIDRLGRKPLLLISCTLLGVLQATTATYYYLDGRPDFDATKLRWIPYTNLLLFAFGYSLGIGIIPSTLLGEVFPANVRSKAAAVSTMFYAFSSFFVNKIFLFVSDNFGIECMFMIFAITNIVAAIFTYFYVIETKGKTLGEIQEILNRKS